ncbi:MAG: modification methylase MjaV [Candidatus Micrarchaeota archaeon]|nr:MAG: modification methylase MjaV [Candidatus Micrarchaeota archaeon]
MVEVKIFNYDIVDYLKANKISNVTLTFFDPPFNQGKDYKYFDDELTSKEYWNWIKIVLEGINRVTKDGGSIYFMQREKNAEWVLKYLRKTGWKIQNLIIWKKMASAVPGNMRFGKEYQIIAFATKGPKPIIFNKLRIDVPVPSNWKQPREKGVYVTDVWSDIRELTSGYLAGDEPLRDKQGKRLHLQQSPIDLLLRIILSSSLPGDLVFDPCAGTGTTLVVAKQLERNAIGVEIDPNNVKLIEQRIKQLRPVDNVNTPERIKYYRFTEDLEKIWPAAEKLSLKRYGLFSGESNEVF